MKKLLFVTSDKVSIEKLSTQSGIFMQLKDKYEIDFFVVSHYCSLGANVRYAFESAVLKKRNLFHLSNPFAKKASSQLNRILKKFKYDCVFTLSSAAIAYVKTDVPIVYFCDATFKNMVDSYWQGISDKRIKEYDSVQLKALQNADHVICTSEWANNSVVNNYGITDKVSIIHTGASLDCADTSVLEHEGINLLFVGNGKNYVAQGGLTAIECTKRLNSRQDGNFYRLHMVGKVPNELESNDVNVYGALDINVREQKNMLEDLWRSADILIMPTNDECAPSVFCDASAYGIPSVTYNIGGASDYVRNGENGICLPLDAEAEDFADAIEDLVLSDEKLQQMKKRAEEIFIEELNWPVFGNKVAEIIEGLN